MTSEPYARVSTSPTRAPSGAWMVIASSFPRKSFGPPANVWTVRPGIQLFDEPHVSAADSPRNLPRLAKSSLPSLPIGTE